MTLGETNIGYYVGGRSGAVATSSMLDMGDQKRWLIAGQAGLAGYGEGAGESGEPCRVR